MKKLIENMTGGYSSSASVVDNNLIISLPDAKSPVIWRMNIGKIASAALEVREEKDGSFVLTFKHDKGDSEDIAPFDNRAKAVKALMIISSAMQNATRSATANTGDAPSSAAISNTRQSHVKSGKGQWVGGLVGGGVLCALIYVLLTMSPGEPLQTGGEGTQQAGAFSSNTDEKPPQDTGVPISADSFLMGR